MNALCEACERTPSTIVEPCDDPVEPYSLCGECHQRLKARALRPLEWYNLAKRHGWYQSLLHDDFYDQDGTGVQSEEEITTPEKYPAPSLSAVCSTAESLLEWCITRWYLDESEIAAWKNIASDAALGALTSRFATTHNSGIRGTILQIIGRISDKSAADFVRYCWSEYPENIPLDALSEATARCIPIQEGFERVSSALATLEPNVRLRAIYCLGYFAAPTGLDWIELNIFQPITDSWGYLAAMSQPSWPRLVSWLRKGRPLSLVAIDTLIAIASLPTPMLKRRDVRLHLAPTLSVLKETLEEYETRDNVPRVSQRITALLNDPVRISKIL